MKKYCDDCMDDCNDKMNLDFLLRISDMLGEKSIDLNQVAELLGVHLEAKYLILSVLNRKTDKIFAEGSFGLTQEELGKFAYKPGEGIVGKIFLTGQSIVIPKISESKDFQNKIGVQKSQEYSFICVPVRYKNEIIGTLSFHRAYKKNSIFSSDLHFLSIVASMIARAVSRRQAYAEEIDLLQSENSQLRKAITERAFTNIKGNSGKMQEVFALVESVAPTDATVLIRGESGVGKELIADAIHYNSLRKGKPFIKVNCAALPESLIESELFGHEKGAFTGASNVRIGRFEAANGGTIFLDEFGDIPASTQVKLLRVLQEREIERLGSSKPIKIDVRVICATNKNLENLISTNSFREDLYYRINVFPIYIPSLRERIHDIPSLVDHFIEKFNKKHNKDIKRITATAIDTLMAYHWPGNIRELENCVERACILSIDDVIRTSNLPPSLQTSVTSDTESKGTLETIVGKLEKQIIQDTLFSTNGNLIKAANSLGITERMMGIRIKKYEIDPKRFKTNKRNGNN
jgi:Nif-specific regulatory protein